MAPRPLTNAPNPSTHAHGHTHTDPDPPPHHHHHHHPHHPQQPSTTTTTTTTTRLSTVPSSVKSRQQSHLHAQLAQLQAHLADLENLLRMTAVQAEYVRGLGGYAGALYVSIFPFLRVNSSPFLSLSISRSFSVSSIFLGFLVLGIFEGVLGIGGFFFLLIGL